MKTNSYTTRPLGQPSSEVEERYYFANERYAELVRRGEANYRFKALEQQPQPGAAPRLLSRLVTAGRALVTLFIG